MKIEVDEEFLRLAMDVGADVDSILDCNCSSEKCEGTCTYSMGRKLMMDAIRLRKLLPASFACAECGAPDTVDNPEGNCEECIEKGGCPCNCLSCQARWEREGEQE